MKFKVIVTLLVALIVFSTGEAAKVDIYREAIANKTLTLKYKVSTFPVRMTNKEINVDLDLFARKIKDTGHFVSETTSTEGIIVLDKNNSYFEGSYLRFDKNNNYCTLIKDGEVFNFNWEIQDGTKHYYVEKLSFAKSFFGGFFGKSDATTKSTKIKAISKEELDSYQEKSAQKQNPYDILYNDYNFLGNEKLRQALMPVLPPDKIIATPDTPVYEFVGSGNLNSVVSYEDFASENNGVFNAIRYYFKGDKMTKIAMFNYIKDAGKIESYEKYVVDIEEFSTTPDKNYLELPDELIDKTKRE